MADDISGGRWNKAEKAEVHLHVVAAFKRIDQAQKPRRERNLRNLRRAGIKSASMGPRGYGDLDLEEKATDNCVEAAIDTLASHIGSNRPAPFFSVDNASRREELQATLCTAVIAGGFYHSGTYEKGLDVVLDGLRMDEGIFKSEIVRNDVNESRIFPDNYVVDDAEAVNGDPQHHFELKPIDREELLAEHEGDEVMIAKIKSAGRVRDDDQEGKKGIADTVDVIHAYFVPRDPKNKGRHVRCLTTATLLDEEYEEPWAPYTLFRWMTRPQGIHGKGLSEQLAGPQRRLDNSNRKIDWLVTLGTMKIYVDRMMRVDPAQFNNDALKVIEGNGPNPPQMMATLNIPAELFRERQDLRDGIYEKAGISQLMLNATAQPGMESAVGVRAMADKENGRFRKTTDAVDEMYMELARKRIVLSRKIKDYKILAQDGDRAFEVAWAKVDPKDLKYRVKVQPTNLLSSTPAGKRADVQDMVKAGMLAPAQGMKMLFGHPDVKKALGSITASYDVVEMLIARMLDPDEPKYKGPEPFMDLGGVDGKGGAISQVQTAYLIALTKDTSEESLKMLRDWLMAADALNKAEMEKRAKLQAAAQMQLQQQMMAQQPAASVQPQPPA